MTGTAGTLGPAPAPWRSEAGCVIVRVRLTPKSSKDAVLGIEPTAEGPALKARVRAAPADGDANAALLRLLADWLGVAQSSLRLSKGGKSRVKSVEITGQRDELEELLVRRLAALA